MSQSTVRRVLPGILRVLVSGILLTALFAGCLYLYHTAFPFWHNHLIQANMKTTAWFVEQLSFSLPFLVICLFYTIAYRGMDRRDGVVSREKMWIAVVVTALTYGVLLPILNQVSKDLYASAVASGATIPETSVGVPWTLMMKLHDWFIRLPIPMALLIAFYGVRSAREKECPDEPGETPCTVEEYEARQNAEKNPHPPVEEEAAHV